MISQGLRGQMDPHRRAQFPFVLTLAMILALFAQGGVQPLSAAEDDRPGLDSETKAWHDDISFGALDPLPTLGGRQFWIDRHFHAGWRIQQNVFTDHFRLLDPEDRRHAWGDKTEVEGAFEKIREDRQLRPASPHLVVLLHGWGRTRYMFDALSENLAAAGYEVAKLSYPSTQQDLARHAADLAALLSRLEGSERVSFVTHSLGAMVLRRMLADEPRFENGITLDRAVLIAPPKPRRRAGTAPGRLSTLRMDWRPGGRRPGAQRHRCAAGAEDTLHRDRRRPRHGGGLEPPGPRRRRRHRRPLRGPAAGRRRFHRGAGTPHLHRQSPGQHRGDPRVSRRGGEELGGEELGGEELGGEELGGEDPSADH